MSKRLPAFGVLAIGVIVLVVLFNTSLFGVGSAFEELTDEFRPLMTDEAISAAAGDVAGLGDVAEEFETDLAPAVASALGMSPDELDTFLGTNFPAVAAGVEALPNIVSELSGVVGLLGEQQDNFASADQIPTSFLPANTVPWIILLIGIGAVLVAILMLGDTSKPWLIAALFGVVVIALSLRLSFLPKSTAADDMNAALKPVYTEQLVADSGQALGVVGAMGQQMKEDLLPALGQQLNMTEQQMDEFLRQFPATAAALDGLDDSLERFQTMVTAFDGQLDNYDTIKETALYPIALMVLVAGLLSLGCGIWSFIVTGREERAGGQPPPA
jgi:hypothetical protein